MRGLENLLRSVAGRWIYIVYSSPEVLPYRLVPGAGLGKMRTCRQAIPWASPLGEERWERGWDVQ